MYCSVALRSSNFEANAIIDGSSTGRASVVYRMTLLEEIVDTYVIYSDE